MGVFLRISHTGPFIDGIPLDNIKTTACIFEQVLVHESRFNKKKCVGIDRFSSLITVCSPVLILPDKFCFMSDFLLITKASKFFISGIRRRDIPPGVGDSSSALRKGRYRRPAGGGAGHGRRRARVHLRQRVPRYIPVSKVLRPA